MALEGALDMTWVRLQVVALVREHGGKSGEEAEAYVTLMIKQRRYLQDIWS